MTVARIIPLNRYYKGNMKIGNISSSAPGYLLGKRKHQYYNKQFLNFKLYSTNSM